MSPIYSFYFQPSFVVAARCSQMLWSFNPPRHPEKQTVTDTQFIMWYMIDPADTKIQDDSLIVFFFLSFFASFICLPHPQTHSWHVSHSVMHHCKIICIIHSNYSVQHDPEAHRLWHNLPVSFIASSCSFGAGREGVLEKEIMQKQIYHQKEWKEGERDPHTHTHTQQDRQRYKQWENDSEKKKTEKIKKMTWFPHLKSD